MHREGGLSTHYSPAEVLMDWAPNKQLTVFFTYNIITIITNHKDCSLCAWKFEFVFVTCWCRSLGLSPCFMIVQKRSAVAPTSISAWAGAPCYWNEVSLWKVSDLWKEGRLRLRGEGLSRERAKLFSLFGLGKWPLARAFPIEPRSSRLWWWCRPFVLEPSWPIMDSSELVPPSHCSVDATDANAFTIALTVLQSLVRSSLLLTMDGFFPILFNLPTKVMLVTPAYDILF